MTDEEFMPQRYVLVLEDILGRPHYINVKMFLGPGVYQNSGEPGILQKVNTIDLINCLTVNNPRLTLTELPSELSEFDVSSLFWKCYSEKFHDTFWKSEIQKMKIEYAKHLIFRLQHFAGTESYQ